MFLQKLLGGANMEKMLPMLLNQFKKGMKDEGIKHLFISLNENDEATIENFKEPMRIVSEAEYKKYLEYIKNQLL